MQYVAIAHSLLLLLSSTLNQLLSFFLSFLILPNFSPATKDRQTRWGPENVGYERTRILFTVRTVCRVCAGYER